VSLVERLAEKWDLYVLFERKFPMGVDPRWWLQTIADEMDELKGDEAADLYDAYEADNIPKWLRAQAEEE